MIFYEDLLSVPYKAGGRDLNGLDCYGLVLECCKRAGNPIPDLANGQTEMQACKAVNYFGSLGVKEITQPVKNGLVQCEDLKGNLHIAFLLNKTTVIHCTFDGVKLAPLFFLHNPKFFKVIK